MEDKVDSKKKCFELDTRLLMEGYGNYPWDSRVVKQVQMDYALESGFMVSGKIADADLTKEKQVYLVSDQTMHMAYEDLQRDKTFTANMNLYAGDSLAITIIGAKGKLRKAAVIVDFDNETNTVPVPYLSVKASWNREVIDTTTEIVSDILSTKINVHTIVLEEAIVKAKSKTEKIRLLSAISEQRIIDDEDIKRIPSVLDYFRRLGLSPVYLNGQMQFRFNKLPFPISFISINGMAAGLGEIDAMPLSLVQSLVVLDDRVAGKHAVAIQLREGHYINPEKRNKYVRFLITHGYSSSNPYTEPGYINYDSDYYGYYGALDWQPNVIISNKKPTTISIPVHGQENLKLFIEGMANDGTLLSISKEIAFSKP